MTLVSLCVYVFTYDQDIVELLHSIYLGQQLVDDSVVDSGAACHAATLLTDGINLIEYDDVKPAVGTKLFDREGRREINNRKSKPYVGLPTSPTQKSVVYVNNFF